MPSRTSLWIRCSCSRMVPSNAVFGMPPNSLCSRPGEMDHYSAVVHLPTPEDGERSYAQRHPCAAPGYVSSLFTSSLNSFSSASVAALGPPAASKLEKLFNEEVNKLL